jgi:hypothetical protein
MMNYTENTHSSTPVPLSPVSRVDNQQPIIEELAELALQNGRKVGRTDAKRVLTQAEQRKGARLTRAEMREAISPLCVARLQEAKTGDKPEIWYTGWHQGYMHIYLDAEQRAESEPVAPQTDVQRDPVPVVLGTTFFRRAVIQTEDMDELALGIVCGQESGVDLQHDQAFITTNDLAAVFFDTVNCSEPEPFTVGFLIGFVDALLRARKTYPHG